MTTGSPASLASWAQVDIRIEVGRGVEVPVVRHRLLQLGRVAVVPPEPAKERLGLAETEEVLGDGQLLDPGRLRLLAVGGQLLNGQRRLPLVVRPQVEVVVEHRDWLSRRDEPTSRRREWWSARRRPAGRRPACR